MGTLNLAAIFVITFLFIVVNSIPDYSDLPPGPYCRKRGCCADRQDECSAPIIGTFCYCDDFCNRTNSEDCCPDFWSHCKGVEVPAEIRVCTHEGRNYAHKQTVKKNCNLCACQSMGNKLEMVCENNICLVEPEIVNTVNQLSTKYGWTATNYSKFWGRSLEDGITLRLGTLQPQRFVLNMNPVRRIYDSSSLPRHFSSETKWPGLVGNVQDQGWCGSSWAISTASVASDRFGIISKKKEIVQLSPQHLLSCDNRGQQSCNGGHLDRAWMYIRKYGLVDEECFPYRGEKVQCTIPKRGNLLSKCKPPPNPYRTEKYRVAPAYRLGNETDIMYEIMKSGPVQATMKVYHDFFTYQGGIYKHSELSLSHRTGYHSVKIVGWGEEYSFTGLQKYWIVANSWGRDWGENGYFRIQKGTNECDIESFVLGTWPEIKMK